MNATAVFAGLMIASACSAAAFAADGAKVYAEICQVCHQAAGVGSPGLAPPLVSPIIASAANKQKDYPAMVVIDGLSGTLPLADGTVITSAMPPQRELNDEDVAAVVNYVFRLNRAPALMTSATVAHLRGQSINGDELKRIRSGLAP
jgi:mono/diheme cytochrome c family protein